MSSSQEQQIEPVLIRKLCQFPDLTNKIIQSWHDLRDSNPALYSPYFHPDYTKQISKLRKDVNVAILEEAGEVIAVLPFQGRRFASPVGAPMTDYHGVICHPEKPVSVQQILEGLDIQTFDFNSLVASQKPEKAQDQNAAVMTFPNGIENWLGQQNAAFTKHQRETRRRLRKASSEIGEPKFISLSSDSEILKTLIMWKEKQYCRNKIYNVLGVDWTLRLLETLLERQSDSGVRLDMHALYFGDNLAAVDTGLTDGKTYHRWIVAYDPKFHQYAPGTQILNYIIRESNKLGYIRIDHGVEREDFKKYYATDNVACYAGYTSLGGYAGLIANCYNALETGGVRYLGDTPGKLRRRYHQVSNCETDFLNAQKAMVKSVFQKLSA